MDAASKEFPTLSDTMKCKLIPLLPFASSEKKCNFCSKHGLRPPGEYFKEAKKSRGLARALFLVLAGKEAEAAACAVQCLKRMLASPAFNFRDALRYVELIQDVYAEKRESEPIWYHVIALSFYRVSHGALASAPLFTGLGIQ
jgi:hypothetical protein